MLKWRVSFSSLWSIFSKGNQQSWFRIKVFHCKNATECYQGSLVACGENALPYRTVPLIVTYDWEGAILTHAVTTETNCQCRLLFLFSTATSKSGYVDGAAFSYYDGSRGKTWNILSTHLTWIFATSISFRNWRNFSKAPDFKCFICTLRSRALCRWHQQSTSCQWTPICLPDIWQKVRSFAGSYIVSV